MIATPKTIRATDDSQVEQKVLYWKEDNQAKVNSSNLGPGSLRRETCSDTPTTP